jgi:ZIP family zinc transporter
MQLDQGWTLTFMSSILCVSGCLVIFVENLYYLLLPELITSRHKFHLKDNYRFLNGSMAFSSGCLIFTSLFRLLPESLEYFTNSEQVANDKWLNFCVIVSYAVGVTVCLLFNTILHLMTSESVVHCGHGTEPHGHSHDNQLFLHNLIPDRRLFYLVPLYNLVLSSVCYCVQLAKDPTCNSIRVGR